MSMVLIIVCDLCSILKLTLLKRTNFAFSLEWILISNLFWKIMWYVMLLGRNVISASTKFSSLYVCWSVIQDSHHHRTKFTIGAYLWTTIFVLLVGMWHYQSSSAFWFSTTNGIKKTIHNPICSCHDAAVKILTYHWNNILSQSYTV
jgi:hypothetical protein